MQKRAPRKAPFSFLASQRTLHLTAVKIRVQNTAFRIFDGETAQITRSICSHGVTLWQNAVGPVPDSPDEILIPVATARMNRATRDREIAYEMKDGSMAGPECPP